MLRAHVDTAVTLIGPTTEQCRPNVPIEALQQLVRNAVMHRTYEATNAPVRVTSFDDRIEGQSPGGSELICSVCDGDGCRSGRPCSSPVLLQELRSPDPADRPTGLDTTPAAAGSGPIIFYSGDREAGIGSADELSGWEFAEDNQRGGFHWSDWNGDDPSTCNLIGPTTSRLIVDSTFSSVTAAADSARCTSSGWSRIAGRRSTLSTYWTLGGVRRLRQPDAGPCRRVLGTVAPR